MMKNKLKVIYSDSQVKNYDNGLLRDENSLNGGVLIINTSGNLDILEVFKENKLLTIEVINDAIEEILNKETTFKESKNIDKEFSNYIGKSLEDFVRLYKNNDSLNPDVRYANILFNIEDIKLEKFPEVFKELRKFFLNEEKDMFSPNIKYANSSLYGINLIMDDDTIIEEVFKYLMKYPNISKIKLVDNQYGELYVQLNLYAIENLEYKDYEKFRDRNIEVSFLNSEFNIFSFNKDNLFVGVLSKLSKKTQLEKSVIVDIENIYVPNKKLSYFQIKNDLSLLRENIFLSNLFEFRTKSDMHYEEVSEYIAKTKLNIIGINIGNKTFIDLMSIMGKTHNDFLFSLNSKDMTQKNIIWYVFSDIYKTDTNITFKNVNTINFFNIVLQEFKKKFNAIDYYNFMNEVYKSEDIFKNIIELIVIQSYLKKASVDIDPNKIQKIIEQTKKSFSADEIELVQEIFEEIYQISMNDIILFHKNNQSINNYIQNIYHLSQKKILDFKREDSSNISTDFMMNKEISQVFNKHLKKLYSWYELNNDILYGITAREVNQYFLSILNGKNVNIDILNYNNGELQKYKTLDELQSQVKLIMDEPNFKEYLKYEEAYILSSDDVYYLDVKKTQEDIVSGEVENFPTQFEKMTLKQKQKTVQSLLSTNEIYSDDLTKEQRKVFNALPVSEYYSKILTSFKHTDKVYDSVVALITFFMQNKDNKLDIKDDNINNFVYYFNKIYDDVVQLISSGKIKIEDIQKCEAYILEMADGLLKGETIEFEKIYFKYYVQMTLFADKIIIKKTDIKYLEKFKNEILTLLKSSNNVEEEIIKYFEKSILEIHESLEQKNIKHFRFDDSSTKPYLFYKIVSDYINVQKRFKNELVVKGQILEVIDKEEYFNSLVSMFRKIIPLFKVLSNKIKDKFIIEESISKSKMSVCEITLNSIEKEIQILKKRIINKYNSINYKLFKAINMNKLIIYTDKLTESELIKKIPQYEDIKHNFDITILQLEGEPLESYCYDLYLFVIEKNLTDNIKNIIDKCLTFQTKLLIGVHNADVELDTNLFNIRIGFEDIYNTLQSYLLNKEKINIHYFKKKGKKDKGNYYNGYARVKINNQWGFVDEKDNLVVPCIYDEVYSFNNGEAFVRQYNEWSIIDTDGNILVDSDDISIIDDIDLKAIIKKNNKYGIVDIPSEVVIDFKYEGLWVGGSCDCPFLLAKQQNRWGIIDWEENVEVDFKYRRIGWADECGYWMKSDDNWHRMILRRDHDYNEWYFDEDIATEIKFNGTSHRFWSNGENWYFDEMNSDGSWKYIVTIGDDYSLHYDDFQKEMHSKVIAKFYDETGIKIDASR